MISAFTQRNLCCLLVSFLLCPLAASAQFTNGNVVVLQAGTGTSALTAAATPVVLKEYNTTTAGQTTPVKTVYVDTTGSARLTISGTANYDGQMTLSSDSSRLVIAGYDAPVGTLSVASSASNTIARAIDTLSNRAIAGRADTTQTAFSGNSIRSATRNGAENYWAAGGITGTYYLGNLSTPAIIQSSISNTRVILATNGKLYFTVGGSSSSQGRLARINGQPTAAATPDTLLLMGNNASPSGFAINSTETIVYVADDRNVGTTASPAGGIQKWTLSGGVWSLTYTLGTGSTSTSGARSVIADWSSTPVVLYATTAGTTGNLIKIVDSNSGAVPLVLATGATNTAFRSVAFAPGPCTVPTLSFSTTPVTCSGNGSVTLTTGGGTGPFSFAYTGPGTYSATTQNISNLTSGTYNVTVTGNGGCTTTGSATVANNALLTATATPAGSSTRCFPDSVLLSANAGTGYRYQWMRGAVVLPNDTLQTYKAGVTGSYSVKVSAGINCTSVSSAVTVTINPLPATTITVTGSTSICSGGSVQLCTGTTIGNTYKWRRNGLDIPGANYSCDTATTSGVYKVVIMTINGCTDSSTGTTITVGAAPTATITPTGTFTRCEGDSVLLHTNKMPGLQYVWLRNGSTIATAGDSTLLVGTSGIYRAVISAGAGCNDTSARDTVVINPLPGNNITRVTRDTVCAGDTIRIHAAGGAAQYNFQMNGSNYQTGADSNTYYATNPTLGSDTPYTFRVLVRSAAGCIDSSFTVLSIASPLPQPTVSQIGGGLLDAGGGDFAMYQWYRNDTLIVGATSRQYLPTFNAFYKVRVTNDLGCSAISSSFQITDLSVSGLTGAGIRVYPNPAQQTLYITSPITVNITLRDLSGRIVLREANANAVSLKSLSDGVYVLSVYSTKGQLIGTQLVTKASH